MNLAWAAPFFYRFALLLRPLMQRLPRGNVWLYCVCCDRIPQEFWRAMPGRLVVFRDRLLDASVMVDLADMRGRSHFFWVTYQGSERSSRFHSDHL